MAMPVASGHERVGGGGIDCPPTPPVAMTVTRAREGVDFTGLLVEDVASVACDVGVRRVTILPR